MSFFGVIEKLRKKSEQDRKTISLIGASTVFGLIFFVWLTTFQLSSEEVKNEKVYDELSPASSLKNMSSRFFEDIKKELGSDEEDDSLKEQTEVAATYNAVINSPDDILGTTTDEIQNATSSVDVDVLDDVIFEEEGEKKDENDVTSTIEKNE